MSLQVGKFPKRCPVCGEELKRDGGAEVSERMIVCANCDFKIELAGGSVEDAEEMLKREDEKIPQDYDVLDRDEGPGEDVMTEYKD